MYLEKFRLDGRVALVTGGAQGIGLACVEALAEAGARVVIVDRSDEHLKAACEAMALRNHKVSAERLDVTDSRAVDACLDAVVESEGRLDILVNNAGIARSETPAEDVADEHWLNVLDVNLNGSFWCARAAGRHMLAQGSGAIEKTKLKVGFMSSDLRHHLGRGLGRGMRGIHQIPQ